MQMNKAVFCTLPVLTTLALAGLNAAPAQAQIKIVPTFDSSITSDPNAAAIESAINVTIQGYETTLKTPITVNIDFKSDPTVSLGQSETFDNVVSYTDYRAALQTHATSIADFTALAGLPTGPTNPVNGGTMVDATTANLRALGFAGNTVPIDSTISLNLTGCQFPAACCVTGFVRKRSEAQS